MSLQGQSFKLDKHFLSGLEARRRGESCLGVQAGSPLRRSLKVGDTPGFLPWGLLQAAGTFRHGKGRPALSPCVNISCLCLYGLIRSSPPCTRTLWAFLCFGRTHVPPFRGTFRAGPHVASPWTVPLLVLSASSMPGGPAGSVTLDLRYNLTYERKIW